MVVQHRRYKVKLDVRPAICCKIAGNEASGLGEVGCDRAFFSEQVSYACQHMAELVIGVVTGAGNKGADIQVVLQVLTDAFEVELYLDAVRL